MTKGSIQKQDFYTHQHICTKYKSIQIHKININRHKRRNLLFTLIVKDFNIPLTQMKRPSRQRINKATQILNDIIEQLDSTGIFRKICQPKHRIYMFFKCTWNILQDIDHNLGHNANVNTFKSTEIISRIQSDHSGMKLEINHWKRN